MFPDRKYFNLENPSTLDLVSTDPTSFMQRHGTNVIVDEAQRLPELFSYIQASVDDRRRNGRIILSGSQNVLLSDAISQTLAGRAAYCELLPLTQTELKSVGQQFAEPRPARSKSERPGFAGSKPAGQTADRSDATDLFGNIFMGSYPGQRSERIPPEIFFDQYIATYVERDVRAIRNVSDLATFRSFMRLLAGRIGQLLDYTSLANDAGVSPNTVKNWLSVLEASYLLKILRPLHNNFGKRYIKSPKVYFLDTGLACRLLGIQHAKEIETHYLRGSLFENFVVAELHKEISSRNIDTEMFFYRDAKQNEVDLVLRSGLSESVVEIKSASGFSASMLKGLHFWDKLLATRQAGDAPCRASDLPRRTGDTSQQASGVPQLATRKFVVYAGKATTVGGAQLLPWTDLGVLLG
ncbi:MAG: ATP-binding protein [Coriobacteriia bacterium]|nr:ATP-binding protein [Coriobacteriia bacterium]